MRPSKDSESLTIQGAKASLLDDEYSINEKNNGGYSITNDIKHLKQNDNDPNNNDDTDDDKQYEPSLGWCAQWRSLSYNIKLILIYTWLWGSATSIWSRQLLATYIFQITGGSTEILGFIEAVQGGAYLIAAIIAGIVTDKSTSRITIIRLSGIIGLVIVVPLGVFTLLYVNTKYDDSGDPNKMAELLYKLIYYVWLFVYGICASFCNTIISTTFTDLIPKGKRDFIFSFQWFIRRMASTLGPLIIVAMFYFLGNHWKIYEMNIVLLSGIGLWCLPLLMLVFGFKTKDLQIVRKKNDDKETEIEDKNDKNKKDDETINTRMDKYKHMVPWIMLTHRLILATGAGMTVKFFPIFFEEIIGLTPIALNSIWVATPFITAIFTVCVERFANKTSRVIAMIVFKSFAVGCLVLMATITTKITKYANIIMVIAYVIRTASMNCAYPLEKAILMDHVDKKNRGKWNAIESVNATVWTLSAAFGGYLIGVIGYRNIYLMTASIYTLCILLLIPLNCITK